MAHADAKWLLRRVAQQWDQFRIVGIEGAILGLEGRLTRSSKASPATKSIARCFPLIDENKDEIVSPQEYRLFQAFKRKHGDRWQKVLRMPKQRPIANKVHGQSRPSKGVGSALS